MSEMSKNRLEQGSETRSLQSNIFGPHLDRKYTTSEVNRESIF